MRFYFTLDHLISEEIKKFIQFHTDVCLGGDIEPGSPTGTAFRAMDTLGITEKNEDIYEIVGYYITVSDILLIFLFSLLLYHTRT